MVHAVTSAFLLLHFYCEILAQSHTNFVIKRFELCNNTQRLIKFYGNITEENGVQYLDFNVSSPIPWDENVGTTVFIESAPDGKMFLPLFTIREKNICKACNSYLREFWYDIARAAQVPPGVCPVRAGRYHASHVPLDFHKMALQTFPFGSLRFTIKTLDNRNSKKCFMCLLVQVENLFLGNK